MKNFAKISVLVLAIALVFGSLTLYAFAAGTNDGDITTVYLAPNANWAEGNARFAVYCENDSENEWVDMQAVPGAPGMYFALIPVKYEQIAFCSMNPQNPNNNWNERDLVWFSTDYMPIPDQSTLYTIDDGEGNHASGEWSSYIPVAKIGTNCFGTLQAAIDSVTTGTALIDITRTEITEDVVVVRSNDVNLTINGNGVKFNGTITVDGKSATYPNGSLTIKNFNFDATGIAKDACINFGGTNATRYITNVTVENCTFTGGNRAKAAIKSYTGGDKNIAVVGCTVDNTMHSILQMDNVTGLVVDSCTINSKNGINLNDSSDVEVKNSEINVSGYALRTGQSSGSAAAPVIELTNNTIHTNGTEGDPAIIIRGSASQAELSMADNAVTTEGGVPHIGVANMPDASGVEISADANYWGEELSAPTTAGVTVDVSNSYSDPDCNDLVFGGNIVARIDGEYYFRLQDAVNAGNGMVIMLLADIELTKTLVIPADTAVTIDLNGYVITYAPSDTKATAVIENRGALTIKDSVGDGKVTTKALNPDTNWGGEGQLAFPAYANNTIANKGTLVLESGTIENTSAAGGATYAIDNYAGKITINGGLVYCENNIAIRLFANNTAMGVEVNGGEIEGTRAIWIQLPSSNASIAPEVTVTVTDGIFSGRVTSTNYYLAIYSYNYGNDPKNVSLNISGGTFNGDIALTGGTNKTAAEKLNITGGTFNGYIYSYASEDLAMESITVSGGKFASDEINKYCTNGFKVVANAADGTYTIVSEDQTPVVGENGNWWIGGADTGLSAGIQDVTPYIGENGNWWIGGVDLGIYAHGCNFVDGKCACGKVDPNYVAPHTHSFVDGKCECGEIDPNYVAPEEPKEDTNNEPSVTPVEPQPADENGADMKTIIIAAAAGLILLIVIICIIKRRSSVSIRYFGR